MPTRKLDHLCVPVDSSDAAQRGVELAATIAARHKSRVTLIHASEHEGWTSSLGGELVTVPPSAEIALEERSKEHAEALLERAADQVRATAPGTIVDVEFRWGRPGTEVLEFAEESVASMIVAGSGGHGLFTRLFHTSVSGELARNAPCPVLLCGPGSADELPTDGFRNVLIAVDYTDAAERGAELAAELVAESGTLHFVHIWELAPEQIAEAHAIAGAPTGHDEEQEHQRREEMQALRSWVTSAASAGTYSVGHVEMGSPRRDLVRCVEEIGADLVVVGSHAHEGVMERVLGTVADHLFAKVKVPVLAVPRAAG